MTATEEFDARYAFKAKSLSFHASELAGGMLPSDVRLTSLDAVSHDHELQYSLRLVAKVLFHKSNGLEGATGAMLGRAIKDLHAAEHSVGLAGLEASRLILTSVLQNAQKTRNAHIETQAASLNARIAGVDAWVSLREPCDAPLILDDEAVDRTGAIIPVARLRGFDIQRTEDGRPDPVALVEGADGARGLYPHRMDLYIGSSALDQTYGQ